MEKAVLLALAASFCPATASVCQRLGARSHEGAGFDVWLVFRLARQPAWLLGLASMTLGWTASSTGGFLVTGGDTRRLTCEQHPSPTPFPRVIPKREDLTSSEWFSNFRFQDQVTNPVIRL